MSDVRARLGETFGAPVTRVSRLHGGMIAKVQLVEFADGRRVVAKSSGETPLTIEGRMLQYLEAVSSLPIPAVLAASDDLLVLEYLEGESRLDSATERHAAELLAELHSIGPRDVPSEAVRYESAPASKVAERGGTAASGYSHGAPSTPSSEKSRPGSFGLHFDTLIGPFWQGNAWTADWAEFYRDQRLRPMLEVCRDRGRLSDVVEARLLSLIDDLPRLLAHSKIPGLIHGDIWSGNVLARDGRITGLLDPAIYFADPEVELAFIELFSTFGAAFWGRYEELRGVDSGYHEWWRRDVYQLYPLLVHMALFGGSYVRGVEERLDRLGY